jgi:hypothetical protein
LPLENSVGNDPAFFAPSYESSVQTPDMQNDDIMVPYGEASLTVKGGIVENTNDGNKDRADGFEKFHKE